MPSEIDRKLKQEAMETFRKVKDNRLLKIRPNNDLEAGKEGSHCRWPSQGSFMHHARSPSGLTQGTVRDLSVD